MSSLTTGSVATFDGMTPCPHCHQPGIGEFAKRASSREHPAECALCGKLSHVIASAGPGIFWFTAAIAIAATIAGLAAGYWLAGLVAGIAIGTAYNRWAWRRVELFPISVDASKRSRRAGWVVNVLALLGIIGS